MPIAHVNSIAIIGAGHAGARVAGGLRAAGFSGDISLFGEEAHLPYERPPLSKGFLCGEVTEADCLLYGHDFYCANRISLNLGSPVTGIDPQARILRNGRGETESYDRLIIATGASARRLQCDVSDNTRIYCVRTIGDVVRLRGALAPHRRVLVVGAGLIGLEVAAAAVRLRCSVMVVETSDVPMGRVVPRTIAIEAEKLHRRHGVEFVYSVQLVSVKRRQGGYEVRLSDGQKILSDCIVVGIGAVPNVTLAEDAGLAVSNGVCVNEYLQTTDERIFAVGDVCAFPDRNRGASVRLESWRNAEEQAATVVAAITGEPVPYRPVPWFWSDQFDQTLQVVGHPAHGQRTLLVDTDDHCVVEAYVDADDHIVGAAGFGALSSLAKEIKLAERLIKSRERLVGDDVRTPRLNLRKLFERTRRENRG